ncbi:hypothetical protein Bca4012_011949 [Brassica carinata]
MRQRRRMVRHRSRGLGVVETDRHDGEMGRLPRRHGSGGPVSETKNQKMEHSRRP